ncbi:MAG: LPS export ABC transporter ATP-binding protein [Acidaminococcaceae bacterium]|nr:LPS export ABC transporter ATP-binding protein [Acidaminococcaceae bacterium]
MIIETKNLVKIYGERKVVNNVSLQVEQGTIVGLLGPNGAGKTTTFYMVVGIAKPDSGTVTLDGEDISQLSMYQRARLGIGYLPQEASIFRKMTVEENLLSILETTSLSHEKQLEKMEDLLEEFDINHVRKSIGTALSGGERRRVEIARSLATDPAFILLDEPFAGIDPIAVADIQDMIAHLAKRGIGILITDHNVRETLSIVDKAYILASGEVLLHGDSESIANDPIARKYYLGENFKM